jgi:hypothetical protein
LAVIFSEVETQEANVSQIYFRNGKILSFLGITEFFKGENKHRVFQVAEIFIQSAFAEPESTGLEVVVVLADAKFFGTGGDGQVYQGFY